MGGKLRQAHTRDQRTHHLASVQHKRFQRLGFVEKVEQHLDRQAAVEQLEMPQTREVFQRLSTAQRCWHTPSRKLKPRSNNRQRGGRVGQLEWQLMQVSRAGKTGAHDDSKGQMLLHSESAGW